LSLLQEQSAQGSQVVQNSATGGHGLTQFRQVGGDKLEGLLAAVQERLSKNLKSSFLERVSS
jgi:hypothetical protein